uniref:Uncharacterized protein n=1 Tax=Vitis vinifera TaxID=29760 RepID=A5AL93_VITVI|nr:hypothetical protein VITISV_013935 [Vitis vinifera]
MDGAVSTANARMGASLRLLIGYCQLPARCGTVISVQTWIPRVYPECEWKLMAVVKGCNRDELEKFDGSQHKRQQTKKVSPDRRPTNSHFQSNGDEDTEPENALADGVSSLNQGTTPER